MQKIMQQIYRRTPMSKYNFNKVALLSTVSENHYGSFGPPWIFFSFHFLIFNNFKIILLLLFNIPFDFFYFCIFIFLINCYLFICCFVYFQQCVTILIQISVCSGKQKFTLSNSIYFHFKTPTKMLAFFKQDLRKVAFGKNIQQCQNN